MADIMNIGTSALLSLQQALSTTGHNIANVNTEGYSRQSVEMTTLQPQGGGGGYIGSGVQVVTVQRAYNQFLGDQVNKQLSSTQTQESYYSLASRLDSLLGSPEAGVNPVLERFFNALHDVASNPGSLPERQVLLGEAQSLVDRFHSLDSSLAALEEEASGRMETAVAQINGLAGDISRVNQDIVVALANAGGQPPNDLLDYRDRLVNQLAKLVGVTTVEQSDGSLNVLVGSGQPLVVGGQVQTLQVVKDAFDPRRLDVAFSQPGSGSPAVITNLISGGELQGAIDFRTQVLDPARDELGRLAFTLSQAVNQQHNLGLDLDGQAGGNFFTAPAPLAIANTNNSGVAAVSVTVDDPSSLAASNYRLSYDGSQWLLTRVADGVTQVGAGPFSLDGLTISVGAGAVAGDNYLVRPVRDAAGSMELAIANSRQIAAAAPVRTAVALTNSGSGSLSDLQVGDSAGLPLAAPITLTFNPNALGPGMPGYDVGGGPAGPLAYDPTTDSGGKTFNFPGFGNVSVTVSGVPQAGDTLTIENNLGGYGDNRNALALAALQTGKLLNGGTSSLGEAYGGMVANVAVRTHRAEVNLQTETALLSRAEAARDSLSGVNLEEEAANLLAFQQAYQAAAQLVAVADTLFQTLLNATGR